MNVTSSNHNSRAFLGERAKCWTNPSVYILDCKDCIVKVDIHSDQKSFVQNFILIIISSADGRNYLLSISLSEHLKKI